MTPTHARVLQNALALRAAIAVVLQRFDDLFLALERQAHAVASPGDPDDEHVEPRIDRATYSVVWRGRACPLRNGLPFRLMEVLANRRRQYVSIDELLETVWEERRSGPGLFGLFVVIVLALIFAPIIWGGSQICCLFAIFEKAFGK